jgi:hypothetical protein
VINLMSFDAFTTLSTLASSFVVTTFTEVSEISVISEGTGSSTWALDGITMVGILVTVRVELYRLGNNIRKLQCCRDKTICGNNVQVQVLVRRSRIVVVGGGCCSSFIVLPHV